MNDLFFKSFKIVINFKINIENRNIHIQFIVRIFLFYNFQITTYISDQSF